MEINVKPIDQAMLVELIGDIDSFTAPTAQQRVLDLAKPGCKIVLDMTQVGFMSSAGLRMLLYIYRQISAGGGVLVVTGLSADIQETMSLTGFLSFFKLYDTPDDGLKALPEA